jgi:hypothetical protein
MGSDDKKVCSKTDSRCFGSLLAILYQKFSDNLTTFPINNQYVKLIQTDPAFTVEEKDLIAGLTCHKKVGRPDIKDVLLHEKFIKMCLKSRDNCKKMTATLYHTKGFDIKRLEARLRDISSGRVDPDKEKTGGIFTKVGSFFGKSKSQQPSSFHENTYKGRPSWN